MLFVVFLVGMAVLAAVIVARTEKVTDVSRRLTPRVGSAAPQAPTLADAFPHLRIVIPTDEFIVPKDLNSDDSNDIAGSTGPDIVIGPWRQAPNRSAKAA